MGATSENHKVDYDEILSHIGQFGPWQRRIHFLLWLASAASGLVVVVFSFTAFKADYRCRNPYCESGENMYGNKTFIQESNPGQCEYYQIDGLEKTAAESTCNDYIKATNITDLTGANIKNVTCSNEDLMFDRSIVQSSIVEDFGFVCNKSYLRQIYGAIYMVGLLCGSTIMGFISDKYGRVTAMMIGVVLAGGAGSISAGLPSVHYGFFRFLTGIGGMALFMVTFVICVEYVGVKYTMLTGIVIEIPFALGELLLGLEAYLVRDWVTLQLVAHLPIFALLGLYFLVPESPRWLIAVGRTEEAKVIIQKGAEINGRTLPDSIFANPLENGGKEEGNSRTKSVETLESDVFHEPKATVLDLFRPTLMLFRSTNMFYQWFSVTMCYYGLSFASVNLLGDPYTNAALSYFIEIPGYIFCILAMDCWGRRPILSFCQLISGIACIGAGLLAGQEELIILQVFLSLVGKFGASACFAIVYVYTAELFPTIIRNTAIGACSTIARVGGICANLIGLLAPFWFPAPMVVMGIIAVIAGALALKLPETVGNKLPETMDEAINIGKDSKRGICKCICPKSLHEMFKED